MKRKLSFIFYIFGGLILFNCLQTPAYAQENNTDNKVYYTCFISQELAEEAQQLNIFLSNYFKAFKTNNINELKEFYAPDYISGDGFNKDKVIQLIQESWKITPNLNYTAKIEDLRFDKNFATIEIHEILTGNTKEKSDITGDNGVVKSVVRSLFYLRKYGNGWKIVSDKTLYEETSIKYGKAKDLNINLFAPEQVFSDKHYTISLQAEIPESMLAISSITKESLTYPKEKPEEIFRQIPTETKILERFVQANNKSQNELAVAAVSYCSIQKDSFKTPQIDFAGTAILIKRVNVLNLKTLKN
ncbi:MAG TPA: nuclear transport factor 2 family protein [Candidatus Gastranaerophilales bacterium]|nr:nuclear transport factor 2 family protein [Candidatus Gastranaerophilales bacterium]